MFIVWLYTFMYKWCNLSNCKNVAQQKPCMCNPYGNTLMLIKFMLEKHAASI